MTIVRLAAVMIAATLTVGATACDDGDSGNGDDALAAFCAAYRQLAENNPFATLDVASPGEMRTAFRDLREAADAIDDAAPDELDRLTSEYVDAIEVAVDELDAADFDPRNLDTTAYRRATIDYEAAATALSNEARAHCE